MSSWAVPLDADVEGLNPSLGQPRSIAAQHLLRKEVQNIASLLRI